MNRDLKILWQKTATESTKRQPINTFKNNELKTLIKNESDYQPVIFAKPVM